MQTIFAARKNCSAKKKIVFFRGGGESERRGKRKGESFESASFFKKFR